MISELRFTDVLPHSGPPLRLTISELLGACVLTIAPDPGPIVSDADTANHHDHSSGEEHPAVTVAVELNDLRDALVMLGNSVDHREHRQALHEELEEQRRQQVVTENQRITAQRATVRALELVRELELAEAKLAEMQLAAEIERADIQSIDPPENQSDDQRALTTANNRDVSTGPIEQETAGDRVRGGDRDGEHEPARESTAGPANSSALMPFSGDEAYEILSDESEDDHDSNYPDPSIDDRITVVNGMAELHDAISNLVAPEDDNG